jgi:geranylgeranyl diphosphate synthase type I
VARFKSAKYTIERPLHLGAALAGADPELFTTYSAYGLPLGEAFQLRDDVLGVFGDPSETGKPAGDDLREGKRTALVAYALEHATPAQTDLVHQHLGDPHLGSDGVAALREVLVDTGALGWVETLIDERTEQAMAALDGVAEPARTVLGQLVVAATARHA